MKINIYNLKQKGSATISILSGVCLVIAIGLLFFTWFMLMPKIKENQQKVAVAKADVKELNTRIQEVSKAKVVLSRIEPSLPRFDLALPLSSQYPEVITTLASASNSAELLSNPTIQISTAQDTSFGYDEIGISIDGESYYPNFVNLLNKIFSNLRVMKVSSITATPSDDENAPAGSMSFSIQASAYAKNNNTKSQTGAQASATPTNQGAASTFQQITSK